jgi:lantibiotic modifying enzyme
MEPRYMKISDTPLLTVPVGDKARHLLQHSLEDIITKLPPQADYLGNNVTLKGLWAGPTGFAYLFLHVSSRYPHLKVAGHHALTWAHRYTGGARGHLRLGSRCGLSCEKLAYDAVRACVTRDMAYVNEFLSSLPEVLAPDASWPDELLQGRAGTMYMLRMMRHWVPDSAVVLDRSIASLATTILAAGPEWKWHGKRYLGAVHGDIGIVTQLVLAMPSLAGRLEDKLRDLLASQLANGNWPSSVGNTDASLVQFCHGAPGFLHSLLSLRPYFPQLGQEIDASVEHARQCVWREGLLRKEPSLCHGILGNAL